MHTSRSCAAKDSQPGEACAASVPACTACLCKRLEVHAVDELALGQRAGEVLLVAQHLTTEAVSQGAPSHAGSQQTSSPAHQQRDARKRVLLAVLLLQQVVQLAASDLQVVLVCGVNDEPGTCHGGQTVRGRCAAAARTAHARRGRCGSGAHAGARDVHNCVHASAVALPHAAEARLPAQVPQLCGRACQVLRRGARAHAPRDAP